MPRTLATNVAPTSRLEHLPCELVFLVANELDGVSRIALALTSRTMMSVLGPHTFDVARCRGRVGLARLYLRESLLELLERDSPVLAVCDECGTLHPSVPLSTLSLPGEWCDTVDVLRCEHPDNRLDLSGTNVSITRPFVRKVMLLHRAGHDVSPQLDLVARTTPTRPRRGPYRFIMEDRARISGDSLLLRRQLFVTRASPFQSGTPSVRDLLGLSSILSIMHMKDWKPQVDLNQPLLDKLTAPAACRTRHSRADPSAHLAACYPDGTAPPTGALAATWHCLLTHPVPCCCPVEGAFKGCVEGHGGWFMDHCISVLPASQQSGWDRVLVFTAWRDLGDGISRYDGSVNDYKWGFDPPDDEFREGRGSRLGDVYEQYEGVAEGTVVYTPELPQHVAERLFGLPLD